MSLEIMCRINARVGKEFFTEIVSDDPTSMNNKLLEMDIENTTGLEPSDNINFEKQMKRIHNKLRDLSITKLAKDTETEELYILTKESEYDMKKVIRDVRKNQRFKNNKLETN